MREGERQVAPTLDGIRRDHVARYEWAAKMLPAGSTVLDVGCGVGYGTDLLARAGLTAVGLDISDEAIVYARKHYGRAGAAFHVEDVSRGLVPIGNVDAAVCFEVIEHLYDPRPMLRALRQSARLLLASVPNQDVMPYAGQAFHYRHYTLRQFEALLRECGWQASLVLGQAGRESEVEPDISGRTIVVFAEHAPIVAETPAERRPEPALGEKPRPRHVAIVGLGPSAAQYLHICRGLGGRHRYCDETWTINALGDVFACDRVFHMDDVRIQEIRAAAAPESNIAAMLAWMRTHPGPIITSRSHSDYPGLVEFPLAEVVDACPNGYFNSTAAYAIAYAIWLRVEKISVFGFDFTYPDAHHAEKGRACVEFWLGVASERGIQIAVPKTTSLLDACQSQADRFYGYDTLELDIKRVDGRVAVTFTAREQLPSADEIEARYDHSVHPNPLVEAEA